MGDLFDGPDTPQVASTADVVRQSQQANRDTALLNQNLNQYDQTNSYGSTHYQQVGTNADGTPRYSINSTLSAPQQALLDQLQGTQRTAGSQAGSLLSGDNAQRFYSGNYDIGDAAGGRTKQILDQQISYLTPYYGQQTDQLDAKLRNQGIEPGTAAYKQQAAGLADNQNRSITQALAALQPQSFNQAVQEYNLPQQTAANLARLGAPGSAVAQNQNGPQVQTAGTDVAGINSSTNTANLGAYQADLAQQSAALSGLFGVAGAAIGRPPGVR